MKTVFSEAYKEEETAILQTVMVPSQRNQLLLIKGKYNVTVLNVTVPSLNLIVLQGRMEMSVLSYLFLPDSNTFPVDIVIKCCNFRG